MPGLRFVGAKLIYSPDDGYTWCNQDGSTPVIWEGWSERSRDTMVFFEEPQEAFSLLTILQMGRNYDLNSDGYVYIYAPNGNTEGTMNELVMFRVSKSRLLDRSSYEYFAGMRAGGGAAWSHDIEARVPVATFPMGWVENTFHPYSWMPSVVYNAPFDLYLMSSWGTGSGSRGEIFGVPSYLGFWTSPTPWGPWTQFHEETAWLPEGDSNARAYQPQISSKWVAPDGKSFWLVWTDLQVRGGGSLDGAEMTLLFEERQQLGDVATVADKERWRNLHVNALPHYSFNVQRVDLVTA